MSLDEYIRAEGSRSDISASSSMQTKPIKRVDDEQNVKDLGRGRDSCVNERLFHHVTFPDALKSKQLSVLCRHRLD
jgi:hypothetical protein